MDQRRRKRRKRKSKIRQFIPYLVIILIAACLIVAVILVTGRRGVDNRTLPSMVLELERTSEKGQNDERMSHDTNPQITALVQRYFEAKAAADADTLNQIVESDTPFQKENLKAEAEFTEAYSNISCYIIPGIVENTYITYIKHDVKLMGIATSAPSLICFYICQDENGSMYIDGRKKDGEVAAYMEEVANWPEVRELKNEVNTRYQEACAADDDLRRLRDMLDGNLTDDTSGQEKEDTQPEAEETTAADEDGQTTEHIL